MPTYDYACPACGGFEAFRSLAQRNDPCACPDCGADARRVFVSAPRLACLSSATRSAHETNERAQHAPRSSQDGNYGRLRHPSGCGCCTTDKRGATVTAANGAKGFPSKRPWMISH
ncbi:MAG: zinc ribbon domain-containing protein [Burkholderiaceae bacterium]|nr:zinc ribbon domain-containing protein [Burkholderiaceae bacterium]